jgi:hypothetical protein
VRSAAVALLPRDYGTFKAEAERTIASYRK